MNMTEFKVPQKRIYLFLLLIQSASVILATIGYQLDKKITLISNRYRSVFWDTFLLYITHSATVSIYVVAAVSVFIFFFQKVRQECLKYGLLLVTLVTSSVIGGALKATGSENKAVPSFYGHTPLGPCRRMVISIWSYQRSICSGRRIVSFFFSKEASINFDLLLGNSCWVVKALPWGSLLV